MTELLISPAVGITCLIAAVLVCGAAMTLAEFIPASPACRWATAWGVVLVCLSLGLVVARFTVVAV